MRRISLAIAIASSAVLLCYGPQTLRAQDGAQGGDLRVWRTQAGSYSTKASFVKLEDGQVQLLKPDGTPLSIALEKLSDADQEYVRKRTGDKAAGDTSSANQDDQQEDPDLETKCNRLCEELTKGYKAKDTGGKATIAVVEFSDMSGGVTDFGRLLSEELTTKLFATGKYKVIERFLLNKAIAEHKLQLQGLIDPKSAKELGKILGVDAIASGTIADMGGSLRVNARLISTETAEVLSVAGVTVVKDDAIKNLLEGTHLGATTSGPSGTGTQPDGDDRGEMTVAKATAVGKHYVGTIIENENRKRISVSFIGQDGFLISRGGQQSG